MFEALAENGLAVSIIAVWTMFPVGVALQWKTIARLRVESPTVWQDLGSPANFETRPRPQLRFMGFIWRKEYSQLDDAVQKRLCSLLRWFGLVYLLFLMLGFVSVFLAQTDP
jgi:hypothetical protein